MITFKRFFPLVAILLAALAIFFLSREVTAERNSAAGSWHYDATGAMLEAVVLPSKLSASTSKVMVYDATGEMLGAVVFSWEQNAATPQSSFYDATGVMLDAVVFPHSP